MVTSRKVGGRPENRWLRCGGRRAQVCRHRSHCSRKTRSLSVNSPHSSLILLEPFLYPLHKNCKWFSKGKKVLLIECWFSMWSPNITIFNTKPSWISVLHFQLQPFWGHHFSDQLVTSFHPFYHLLITKQNQTTNFIYLY